MRQPRQEVEETVKMTAESNPSAAAPVLRSALESAAGEGYLP